MARRRPIRLALDQNFPTPILRAIAEFIVDVELIPIREIDARLSTLEDRELLIALKQLGYPGLVTNNYKMLKNPKELAAIIATKLTVFAIEASATIQSVQQGLCCSTYTALCNEWTAAALRCSGCDRGTLCQLILSSCSSVPHNTNIASRRCSQ